MLRGRQGQQFEDDCRVCENFSQAPGGAGYGSCKAHKMLVKLCHNPEPWFSQCQFKALRLERPMKKPLG